MNIIKKRKDHVLIGLTLMKNSIFPCNPFHEVMYGFSYLEQFSFLFDKTDNKCNTSTTAPNRFSALMKTDQLRHLPQKYLKVNILFLIYEFHTFVNLFFSENKPLF